MFLGLKKGDIIDVVAPSCGNFDVSRDQVIEFIKSLGYTARIPENFQEKEVDLFSANTQEIRAKHLIDALQSKDSKAIWMFRGGYGATKLIPELDKYDFSSNPKVLIGFSDITSLGLYFEVKYGWKFIHGTIRYAKNQRSTQEEFNLMKNFLAGEWDKVEYKFDSLNAKAKEEISIKGEITGGNLALIQCSLGTNWQINANNKILFIEDTGERGYRIDRMLEHLKQAGVFNNIRALIFGDITCAPEPNGEFLCDAAISRFIAREMKDVPVFSSKMFGHGRINYPLIFNLEVQIAMGKNPSLVFQNIVD